MITFRDIESKIETDLVAQWYFGEWGIPPIDTLDSLASPPNRQVVFQRMMLDDDEPVGTGGMYLQVGIQKKIPKYKDLGPWIGLMYTLPEKRGKGLGQLLLKDIEDQAKLRGETKLYLFTHTADQLYRRSGWKDIDRIENGDKIVVVMEKVLS